VAGYKQVLEDGLEIDTQESEKEEHGNVLEGMTTADMLDAKGRPVLRRFQLTTDPADALRRTGRTGGQVTATGVR
jgi:hypothetical protein